MQQGVREQGDRNLRRGRMRHSLRREPRLQHTRRVPAGRALQSALCELGQLRGGRRLLACHAMRHQLQRHAELRGDRAVRGNALQRRVPGERQLPSAAELQRKRMRAVVHRRPRMRGRRDVSRLATEVQHHLRRADVMRRCRAGERQLRDPVLGIRELRNVRLVCRRKLRDSLHPYAKLRRIGLLPEFALYL